MAMNWTGGRLSRHSKKGGGALTERQKQYFSKAQAARRGGNRKGGQPSPQKRTFLDQFHIATGIEREASTRSRGSRGPVERELRTVATTQKTRNRPDNVRESHKHNADNTALSRRTTSTRLRSMSIQPKLELPKEDEDYDDASPPRRRKRLSPATELSKSTGDPIQERRRQLLSKKDWIGVTHSQAPKMKFKSRDENIAKRRKVTSEHQAQYSSRQATVGSLFVNKDRPRTSNIGAQFDSAVEQRERGDVRISIGGRIVPPGVSSSSVGASRRLWENTPRPTKQARSESSDLMLLDEEAANAKVSEGSFAAEDEDDVDDGMSENLLDEIEAEARNKYLQSHEAEGMAYFDAGDGSRGVFYQPEPHRPHAAPLLSRRYSSCSIATESPNARLMPKYINKRKTPVIVSSPTDSNLAHVGESKPVVPQTQILEHKRWATWMAPPDESSELSRLNPVSPGVSTGFARSERNVSNVMDVPEHEEVDPDDTAMLKDLGRADQMRINLPKIRHSRQTSRSAYTDVLEEACHALPSKGHEDRGSAVDSLEALRPAQAGSSSQVEASSPESRQINRLVPHMFTTERDANATQDNIWRKFVFGSGSEDDDVDGETEQRSRPRPHDIPELHQVRRREIDASSILACLGTVGPESAGGSPISSAFAQQSLAFDGHYLNSSSPSRASMNLIRNQSVAGVRGSSLRSLTISGSQSVGSGARSRAHSSPEKATMGNMSNESVLGVQGSSKEDSVRNTSGSDPRLRPQSDHFPPLGRPNESPTNGFRFTPRSASMSSGPSSNRKVFFRKPKPFVGQSTHPEMADEETEPVYLGRGRKGQRDLYSMVDPAELEAIEDD